MTRTTSPTQLIDVTYRHRDFGRTNWFHRVFKSRSAAVRFLNAHYRGTNEISSPHVIVGTTMVDGDTYLNPVGA